MIQRHLSEPRLRPYLDASGADLQRAVDLYRWNARVAAAFWEVLGHGEIFLRNAIHDALADRHRRRQNPGTWFDDPRRELAPQAHSEIEVAKRRAGHVSAAALPGKLVAELPFGFWRYLLARRYSATLWPAIRHSFPHLHRGDRARLERPVIRLHLLRNRIAHHEPLLREDLGARRADLRDVLDAMDPRLTSWTFDDDFRLARLLTSRP
ncbi:Abi family protein [Pseudonocardia sp. KRD291]|uniref:Abi family protein n=1 Tax=Pseudonocardia sp. KRD291 TaxID=2792007 RepID=UPI001C4A6DDB|nr:Abi family protein [Pseudonocardia sp. KRD291]MBW0106752.1 Abi family protein [Pseudonocardia sp. KRD291]